MFALLHLESDKSLDNCFALRRACRRYDSTPVAGVRNVGLDKVYILRGCSLRERILSGNSFFKYK
ncbi:hypothetical protein JCM10914_3380 [Paenibacillus sp. JCM 10914]|nr:hypothetical protein JCM10914_3380 [Paenibacillus sp. JCM 10914]